MNPWLKKGLVTTACVSLALSVQVRGEPITPAMDRLDHTLYDMKPPWFQDYERLIGLPIGQQLEALTPLPQDSSLRDALLIRWFVWGESVNPSCPSPSESTADREYPLECSVNAVFTGLFNLPINAAQSLAISLGLTGLPDRLLKSMVNLLESPIAHPDILPRAGCQNVADWNTNSRSPQLWKTVVSAWLMKRCGEPDTDINTVFHQYGQQRFSLAGDCADCQQLPYYHQWLQTIPAWPPSHEATDNFPHERQDRGTER